MDHIDRSLSVLGLSPGATPEDIKQSYRELVKVWHPDRFMQDPRLLHRANENLKAINEAYAILQRNASRSAERDAADSSSRTETRRSQHAEPAASGRDRSTHGNFWQANDPASPPESGPSSNQKDWPATSVEFVKGAFALALILAWACALVFALM